MKEGHQAESRIHLDTLARAVVNIYAPPDLILPIPISENQRKVKTRTGRVITNPKIKKYKTEIYPLIRNLPQPPCVLIYRVFFPDRRRDSHNVEKILVDAIFAQDKDVRPWDITRRDDIDGKDPRVEVWIVSTP